MNSTSLAMNTAGDERRLLQNMRRNRALSCYCSALIDVSSFGYYNIDMDENPVVTLVAIETAAPKRRIARSAGAVYIALIAMMIGCISLGNLLYSLWQISRYVTQPILYAAIAICGAYLYRRHYRCYRYTLTDEMFAIEQIGFGGEKTLAVVWLTDILRIFDQPEQKRVIGRIIRASLPPLKAATWVQTLVDGNEVMYRISASERFVEKLIAQWQNATKPQTAKTDDAAAGKAARKER